jgi:nucleoside-diphosphate-sugar epimerase
VRILLTGATGILGSEVNRLLTGTRHEVVGVARRAAGSAVAWNIGHEPPPPAVRGRWDVIVHTAACTRWTMGRDEAAAANVAPLRAVLDLADDRTHLVHVSTAFVDLPPAPGQGANPEFDGRRNGYEWSKARCEELLRASGRTRVTVIRPPLIIGRRTDGAIARFNGVYSMIHALTSGLGAVVVGSPDGRVEMAPVDVVAQAAVDRALGPAPGAIRHDVVAAGADALTLAELIAVIRGTLNAWRAARGLAPVDDPPLISGESWHRFFLPFVREHLSPIQLEAVRLLGSFESYASMPAPFTPTYPVRDIAGALATAVRYWAETKPRAASAVPRPWTAAAPALAS